MDTTPTQQHIPLLMETSRRFVLDVPLSCAAVVMFLSVVTCGGMADAKAPLYLCTDQSGASVFTDSPVQLKDCKSVEPEEFPEAPSRPTADAGRTRGQPPASSREDIVANTAPAQDPRGVSVPVERVGHLLIVSTLVNRTRDARLILDTGASHTIISHDVAADLGLLSSQQSRFVTLKTAAGAVQAEVVRVDSIRIADAEVRNSLVAVYDMPDAPDGVDGLLGLAFLKQFQVTLDTTKGLLHLGQPGR